jgi:hypothetical protein
MMRRPTMAESGAELRVAESVAEHGDRRSSPSIVVSV